MMGSERKCTMEYLKGECFRLVSISFTNNITKSCKDLLAEMVHTRDGSRVVREFLARGTAKVCRIVLCPIREPRLST